MAKLLVVEDEEPVAALIGDLFEGHEVTVAGDGEAGLARARELRPDLIILDVGLPKLDGLGMLRELRHDPDLKRVKVLMLTGKGTIGDVEQGFHERADDYIVKPFSNKVLIGRVEQLLSRKS